MTAGTISRTAAPLRQEVVNALRGAIVAQEFSPGDRLVETVLCEKYSVSRTVIREALRQLESEGLVTMVAHRGPEVATLSIQEAESLYEVRRALESLAGSLFAERATDNQCTELVARLAALKGAIALGNPRDRLEAKDRYYDVLFEGAGNPEIARMLRSVHARTQILRSLSLAAPGRRASTVAEIARITAAAAVSRDPNEARRACEDHVRRAAAAALSEMRKVSD